MNRDRIAVDVERPRGDQGKVVSMGRRVRILVAHEQTLFRHVLEHALARHEDLHVVANAGTARHAMRAAIRNHPAMRAAIRNHPDVAVVSARLFAGAAGSITRIARELPRCGLIVLFDPADEDAAERVPPTGGGTFLTMGCYLDELVDTVRAAAAAE